MKEDVKEIRARKLGLYIYIYIYIYILVILLLSELDLGSSLRWVSLKPTLDLNPLQV